jgi:nucleoside-diphosphate-sugar epimerase
VSGRALVVGGTGPTGQPVVAGLVDRGYDVAILHRGTHERPDLPTVVRHLHHDPYDDAVLDDILGGASFDLVVAMYGRLRRIAACTAGRVGQFVSVGGVPAYRGWMNPWLADPPGLAVPVTEEAATVAAPAEDEKGFRIVRTEAAVFESHPAATHFRYPYVYGPYQLAPREWSIVRRVLDGRRRIVVADDGLTLHHHGYTENLAHALLLAVDQPSAAVTLATNAVGSTIAVGTSPDAIAITPDGVTAYVTDNGSAKVTPITLATKTAGAAITVGTTPDAVAIK